jgi:hypothetical protein
VQGQGPLKALVSASSTPLLRALAGLGLIGALALGGCAGSDPEGATTASEATSPRATPLQPAAQGHGEGQRQSNSTETKPSGQPDGAEAPTGHPVAGAKATAPGVPVTPEGDNSIQTFGSEGAEAQRKQAAADLQAYLEARARGDWAAACKAASEEFGEELAKLVAHAKAKPGAEKPSGCAGALALLYGKTPSSTLRGAQVSEVLSLRVRGDGYAYLIFKDPQGAVRFIAMADDGGAWKVNTTEPIPFQGSQGEAQ